jgi:outer membrane protein TolC
MINPIKHWMSSPGKSLLSIIWIGLTIALAGCRGPQMESEKVARQNLAQVQIAYQTVPPVLTPDSGLSNYLYYAVLNSPDVAAAYHDWSASVERITSSRSLPDPKLTFQSDIANSILSLMPGLMMDLPGPGKRQAAAAMASAESQTRYFQFQSRILQAAFALKQAYYQLDLLNAKTRVNHRMLDLMSELEKLARFQNETGKGTLQDVLRAEIEQDRIRTELENLEDSRGYLQARFKAALGIGPGQPDPPIPSRFELSDFDPNTIDLLQSALTNNPRIKAMQAEVRLAEAGIAAARKGRVPDFSVGLEADAKSSPVMIRPQAGVTLPIWKDKIAAQIAEAQAGKHAADARLSSEQISLAIDIAEKTYLYRQNTRNLQLLRDRLLPKARQALEISRSSYLSGQTDFLNVIDAEQTQLNFELMEAEARTERELTLAELSILLAAQSPVGSPIPATPAPMSP